MFAALQLGAASERWLLGEVLSLRSPVERLSDDLDVVIVSFFPHLPGEGC